MGFPSSASAVRNRWLWRRTESQAVSSASATLANFTPKNTPHRLRRGLSLWPILMRRVGRRSARRLAPFVERGTDVDVVLDLMIHDIDVIASLVRAPVERVEAVGVPVLTEKPDIANARINFANGCIANVTSSRVSLKRERKIRFFQQDAYISIDYDQRRAQIFYKPAPGAGWLDIRTETIEIKEGDALADEIDSFLDCVGSRRLPLVGGAEGLRALEIASMVSSQL